MIRTAIASSLLASSLAAVEPIEPAESSRPLVGFYLHACWKFAHPYAVRSWSPDDYRGMFRLLRRLDFDTVMLWPVVEAIPMPLSPADRVDLQRFRSTIADAQIAGLRCWLTQCAALGSDPSIAGKPWLERNFYPAKHIVRLDDPAQRQDYFAHRAAIMGELNNADAYVTIDGDPGSYPGATPADFIAVFRADRATIAAVGTHPHEQQVVPWLWAGWGQPYMDGQIWNTDPAPWLKAEAEALAAARTELAPFSVLPGRHATTQHHNYRRCIEAVEATGLVGEAVTFLYQAIEFEPIPPAIEPAFERIRSMMRQEAAGIRSGRGVFGNAQQPLLQLPNLWFFARAARDPAYLDRRDDEVFVDLATFLGGDPALLCPAWRSLTTTVADLPADLPQRLRSSQLGPVANELPGGAARYLDLLARQVECRRACLLASAASPTNDTDAVARCVAGCAAIIAWWQDNQYVFDGAEGVVFRWPHVHVGLCREFGAWVQANQEWLRHQRPAILAGLAGVLPAEQLAARLTDLLGTP